MPISQMKTQRLKFRDCLRLVSQPLRGAGSNPRLSGSPFLSVCRVGVSPSRAFSRSSPHPPCESSSALPGRRKLLTPRPTTELGCGLCLCSWALDSAGPLVTLPKSAQPQ